MFGSSNSNHSKQGRPSPLPTLEYFSDLKLETITDNDRLTALFGRFAHSFTSNDPHVQNIKALFLSVQAAFPKLASLSFSITTKLEDCRSNLTKNPLHTFQYIKISDENKEDMARYAEMLAILHYVLTNHIQSNLGRFLSWTAHTVVDGILAIQRTAHQIQNKPAIGTIDQELDEIAKKIKQWQVTISLNLVLHEERKKLIGSQEKILKEIEAFNFDSDEEVIEALFATIDDHHAKIAEFSDQDNAIKPIEQNTFLITVLDLLVQKYSAEGLTNESHFAKHLLAMMEAVNTSNAKLKAAIHRIMSDPDSDYLCPADEAFYQAYSKYFRGYLAKKHLLSTTHELVLPETSNHSPVTCVENTAPNIPTAVKIPVGSALEKAALMKQPREDHQAKMVSLRDEIAQRERIRLLQEAKNKLKPVPPKDIVEEKNAGVQNDPCTLESIENDENEFMAALDAHLNENETQPQTQPLNEPQTQTLAPPPVTPQPVATVATTRPFLNARRTGEMMTSSLCLLYAGGVGLEALGKISLPSVIEPFFVAATFASPVAIAALAACALVLVIAMAEMAYTYHQNTKPAFK